MSVVAEFHTAFGLPRPSSPPFKPDPNLARLRMRLIREECEEVVEELSKLARTQDPDKATEIYRRLLKELADLIYVAEGCAVSFGLPIEAAYREVHSSNMSKLGKDGKPIYREDGKVLKGPNYREANMEQFVPEILDIQEA